MSDTQPMMPEDKLSIEINHLTVVSLMTLASEDRPAMAEAIGKLSYGAAAKLLLSAIEMGGLMIRLSDTAEAAGRHLSVREILTAAADALSDEVSAPPSTLH